MILINTTFIVHKSIDAQFIKWARETYIAAATESKLFYDPLMTRILSESDPEGSGYAVQLRTRFPEKAELWIDTQASLLRGEAAKKWGEKFLHFTTYMEILEQ